jgi:activating signal cointegrator complex subunit 2
MVPPIVPFPDSTLRQQILPAEWAAYIDSWLSASDLYLRLNNQDFNSALVESGPLSTFIVSFFRELAVDATIAPSVIKLRKKTFLLVHRIWSGESVPPELLDWQLLSNVCHAFPKSVQLQSLLQNLWQRKAPLLEKSLQAVKSSLIMILDSKRPEQADDALNKLGPLLKLSPEVGTFMLTGSDFLDALNSAYTKSSHSLRKKLVMTTYIILTAVVRGPKPNLSLLSDHLYGLKTAAEQARKTHPDSSEILLADLVTNTPFLEKIRDNAIVPEGARVKNIAASLSAFQQTGSSRPKRLIRRRVEKGKGKAGDSEYGHGAFGEIHVHRMSLITQIQDLFPDLGSGFVVKLLDEYKDNIEEVTAHLLEDSLPPQLSNSDRTEQL